MPIEYVVKNNVHVFRPQSDLVLTAVQEAKDAIYPVIGNESVMRILVNLTEVRTIDSLGIGVLVAGLNALTERHGKFAVCGLNERLKSALQIIRLDTLLTIYANETEALEKML